MNPRTLYKKTKKQNSSCRNEQTQHIYIQTLYMWARPFQRHSTDCTHGHCPYSYILSVVLVLAQLQGMLPEGREDAVGAWLQTSLAAQQVEILQRCWVSPSMLPLLYLAPMQEAVSSFPFSQFIWTS